MAITIISQPQNLSPAFNNVNFLVDSTNKNAASFRYVVDVYLAGTATKIHETRVAPRIGDGYGLIPLAKILQAYLSYTLDVTNITSKDAANSFLKFDLKIGEEFVNTWSYDDYEFRTGNKTALNSTVNHTFIIGDQILVSQTDGGALKPMLEGLFTVTEIPNATEIIIDIDFSNVGAGATMGGGVKYADNRTTITRNLATTTRAVFNGAFSFVDFQSYLDAPYKITGASTTNKLLTDLPDNFYSSPTALMFINFGWAESSAADHVRFTNNLGATFIKSIISGSPKWVRQFAAGAGNMGDGGTVVTSTALYYDFWVENAANAQLTKKYRVYIDRRCTISDIEVLFMDRKGSFIPFSFSLREYKTGEIKRETVIEELGDGISYGLQDAGEKTTSVNLKENFRIGTNWLNDEMSILYDQLLTSPQTFIKINSVWQKCIVNETASQTDRVKNKRMIKKVLNVRLSNETNINA